MRDIDTIVTNSEAPSAGFSKGKYKNNPGDDTGSAVKAEIVNDFYYGFYTLAKKWLGDISDTEESELASDIRETMEKMSAAIGDGIEGQAEFTAAGTPPRLAADFIAAIKENTLDADGTVISYAWTDNHGPTAQADTLQDAWYIIAHDGTNKKILPFLKAEIGTQMSSSYTFAAGTFTVVSTGTLVNGDAVLITGDTGLADGVYRAGNVTGTTFTLSGVSASNQDGASKAFLRAGTGDELVKSNLDFLFNYSPTYRSWFPDGVADLSSFTDYRVLAFYFVDSSNNVVEDEIITFDRGAFVEEGLRLLGDISAPNLNKYFTKDFAEDLTFSGGTVKQRIVYAKNLTVSAATTLKARTVWVDGDLTINENLKIEAINPIPDNTLTASERVAFEAFDAGAGGAAGGFYTPGFGGVSQGGYGGSYAGNSGGVGFGNAGGNSLGGGSVGGGGFGGGGQGSSTTAGGAGGGLCIFIVSGDVTIASGKKIYSDGGAGGGADPNFSGGGAGGAIVIICLGTYTNNGSITAKGGSASSDGAFDAGGGGAGGHIEIYANTASFGTIDVSGGVVAAPGNNGSAGTYILVDTTSNKDSILGGAQSGDISSSGFPSGDQISWADEEAAGILLNYIEGAR